MVGHDHREAGGPGREHDPLRLSRRLATHARGQGVDIIVTVRSWLPTTVPPLP